MEVRVYAEDAARGFLPSTGTIEAYAEPRGANVRVDSGVTAGTEVTVHYDPMLSKLIVWGPDRQTAIDRMVTALRGYCILGITTNVEFLAAVVDHPEHRSGAIYTRFLDDHQIAVEKPEIAPDEAWILAAVVAGQNMPGKQAREGLYYYYHVFAKALSVWGEDMLVDAKGKEHNWRLDLINELIERQAKDGSWVNDTTRWLEGDPHYVTALAIQSLQAALEE